MTHKLLSIALLFCAITLNTELYGQEIWTNWAGNQICYPQHIYYPKTIDNLIELVKKTAVGGHTIRILGSSFSYSDIACAQDVAISLKHLNQIMSIDHANNQVLVQAGITLKELNEQLAEHGLAIPNQADTEYITLGGALCTAAHGSGNTGTLSSFITELELLTANGVIYSLSPHNNSELFKAALVSLGALGVITNVTLQCEPLFWIDTQQETATLNYVLDNYKELLSNNNFFRFSWDIKTDQAVMMRLNRAEKPLDSIAVSTVHKCFESFNSYKLDDNDKAFAALEIALPVDALPQAIEQIKLLNNHSSKDISLENDVVIRFVKADTNSYLSPSVNRDVVYINLFISHTGPARANYMNLCKDIENALSALGGRPHWGKINTLTYQKAFELYGENLTKFIAAKKYLDPHNVFSNDFINRICTPSLRIEEIA